MRLHGSHRRRRGCFLNSSRTNATIAGCRCSDLPHSVKSLLLYSTAWIFICSSVTPRSAARLLGLQCSSPIRCNFAPVISAPFLASVKLTILRLCRRRPYSPGTRGSRISDASNRFIQRVSLFPDYDALTVLAMGIGGANDGRVQGAPKASSHGSSFGTGRFRTIYRRSIGHRKGCLGAIPGIPQ
jgi:hypothetical protein